MICFPNAKVNLGIRVTGKRSDGYHNLETIMVPISLCDMLEAVRCKRPAMEVTGLPLHDAGEDNLVTTALHSLQAKEALPPLCIHLHKAIPVGSGLGGGSSDASFALKLFNELSSTPCKEDELLNISEGIGSDCPFFIRNKPAYVTGRGEILQDVVLELEGYHIGVVQPDVHVSTREAYANISVSSPASPLTDLVRKPIGEWKDHILNDFEDFFYLRHPEYRSTKERLYEAGAVFALMSGSGSAFYGIFRDKPDLPKRFPGYYTWAGNFLL